MTATRPRCQARTGGHLADGTFHPRGRCQWYAKWRVQDLYDVCNIHLKQWRQWFGLTEQDYRRLGRRA